MSPLHHFLSPPQIFLSADLFVAAANQAAMSALQLSVTARAAQQQQAARVKEVELAAAHGRAHRALGASSTTRTGRPAPQHHSALGTGGAQKLLSPGHHCRCWSWPGKKVMHVWHGCSSRRGNHGLAVGRGTGGGRQWTAAAECRGRRGSDEEEEE